MKKAASTSFNQEEIAYYLKDVKKCPLLDNEEEKSLRKLLINLRKNNNSKAKKEIEDKLVKSTLRFVITISKEYQGNGLDLPDLIQEGNLGLLKACYGFDPTMEIKFISYAVHWIRQSIKQALNEKSRTIRFPVNIVTNIGKSKNAVDEHEMYLEDLETAYPSTIRLDDSIDEEGNTLLDLIPNANAEPPDEIFEQQEDLKSELLNLLSKLDERERTIVEKYYGITGSQLTLEEIGEDMIPRLTKERVRQIKDRAIRKIRNYSANLFEYIN